MGKFIFLALLLPMLAFSQPSDNPLLQKGWALLVRDDDAAAYRVFDQALQQASADNKRPDIAESLLYLGICSYGSNLQLGLSRAMESLEAYKKLEAADPAVAQTGRSRCLQLIATIYARQGRKADAQRLAREAVTSLEGSDDTSGTRGLAYSLMAGYFEKNRSDSAEFYYKLAIDDFLEHGNQAYLPGAYARLARLSADAPLARKGLSVARQTRNLQAEVQSLLALADIEHRQGHEAEREADLRQADSMAQSLSDKTFEIKTIGALIDLEQARQNYRAMSMLQQRLLAINDAFHAQEQEGITRSLEVQFEVAEKNRKLAVLEKEHTQSRLTNIILAICLAVLITAGIVGFAVAKNTRRRDRQLIRAKEALVDALEKQKALEAEQLRQDINHKESQLSAVTLQILQKNELLSDIRDVAEKQQPAAAQQLLKMVNKRLANDASWSDFDFYFESVNKNFYNRLKERYPEIGANDLKICALIKLNLSIKEMASILNISPDSVKTARYRLRKKLQLQNGENLTDFILSF